MGLFNKIFGGKQTMDRRELMDRLAGVNFQAAAENIAYTFREAAKQAESEGSQCFMKKELVKATDYYMEDPCLERAVTLLEEYPTFWGAFELTKDPLQIWERDFRKSKE